MISSFTSVKLKSLRKLHVFIYTSIPRPEKVEFSLLVNGDIYKLDNFIQNSTNGVYIFNIDLPFDYPFGKDVSLNMTYFGNLSIDTSLAINFPEFDDLFNYDGDDLGVTYFKNKTIFKLWAPLASSVILRLENKDNDFDLYHLIRGEKGVYFIEISGDLNEKKYQYIVTNSGCARYTLDPYAKGVSLDSKYSKVVDISSITNRRRVIPTNKIENYTDSIIYELHIRDFTENKDSNIQNKGKYLGLVEENKISKYGNHVGLDYLKYLNITHVQLLPILDFNSKDIYNPEKDYNWGYDPISLFALEGQYSINPDSGISRIKEFSYMVDKLHQENIRVVLDVVYNHLFEYQNTSLDAVVPNYYFRKRNNGAPSNASGCGNDFNSERYMARKLILDSIKYLIDALDIDGLRFDLMGLIDIDTMKEVEKFAHQRKKDFLIYGEGWNMGQELPFEKKSCIENSYKLENIAFFNDSYRDILKGPNFKDRIIEKGFINGNYSYVDGFHYAFLACVSDFCFNNRFLSANQSINYIECHDNNTLFDKLTLSNEGEDKELLYSRIKLANGLLLLSFGVPFIHMGQEIGQSKFLFDNTYNVPKINEFDLLGLSNRFNMVEYLKNIISLRNNEFSFLKKLTKKEEIDNLFYFEKKNDEILLIKTKDNPHILPYKSIVIVINVSNKTKHYELDDYYEELFSGDYKISKNDLKIKSDLIAPASLKILIKKD